MHVDHNVRIDFIRALEQLPLRQRMCVVLRFYEDLSESATAEAMGISIGAVKSQTFKALRRLETVIGGDL